MTPAFLLGLPELFSLGSTSSRPPNQLLSWFQAKSDEAQVVAAAVKAMLNTTSGLSWEGGEYRAEVEGRSPAFVSAFQESPVHLSVVLAG
jgi:hypothetical protein